MAVKIDYKCTFAGGSALRLMRTNGGRGIGEGTDGVPGVDSTSFLFGVYHAKINTNGCLASFVGG